MRITCPHCSQEIDCPEELAGTAQKCPTCGEEFEVPRPALKKATLAPERTMREDRAAEAVFWDGTPSWFAETTRAGTGIILFLLGLPFAAIGSGAGVLMMFLGILLWVLAAWHHYATRYRITNQRVIYRCGFIFIDTDEVKIRDIRAIRTRSGILCGGLELATAGTTGYEVKFRGLPMQTARDIKAYLDQFI